MIKLCSNYQVVNAIKNLWEYEGGILKSHQINSLMYLFYINRLGKTITNTHTIRTVSLWS